MSLKTNDRRSIILNRLLSWKVLFLLGIGFIIFAFLLFFNSMGSGGGYLAAALILSGIIIVLVAIVKRIAKPVR